MRGKYRLDSLLGVGGMAAVYRATHRNQAELAIKMLHPEMSIYEDFRNRFLKEGYAANSVKHPGVVLVVDDDVTEDGAAFLVMELLRGSSVDGLRKMRGKLAPVEIAAIGLQLLDVLRAAHDKEIVHRDIKPANLFVTHDGTLKVLDFGIARARDEAAPEEHTGTGVLLGTPAFMAPEQANAKASEIDARTDLWAVGATLFTLLTGKAVHQADNPTRALVSAASLPAPKLATVDASVPTALAEIIDRALEFEREKRWEDSRSMRRALVTACTTLFGSAPSRSVLAALVGPPADTSLGSTRPGNEAMLFAPGGAIAGAPVLAGAVAPVVLVPASATPASATPASSTPASATPGPATPGPATPGPATPGPATPGPATPGPATPGPASPGPASPGPATAGPATPAPTTHVPSSPVGEGAMPATAEEAGDGNLSPLSSTTAQPVSSVSHVPMLPSRQGGNRRSALVAAAIVACGGLMLFAALRARTNGSAANTPPADTTQAAPPPPTAKSAPPGATAATAATATTEATAAPPAAEPAAATSAPNPAATTDAAPPVTEPAKPAPPREPTGPAATVASEPPRATTPRKPASKKPDCNPNYTLDKDGNKHFKPECF